MRVKPQPVPDQTITKKKKSKLPFVMGGVVLALVLAALVIFLINMLGGVELFGGAEGSKGSMTLAIDNPYLIVDTETEVIFTLDVGQKRTAPTYKLCAGDTEFGVFHDDGADGDEVADDGIYSVASNLKQSEEQLEYVVKDKKGKEVSNTVTVYTFRRPTQEEAEQYQKDIPAVDEKMQEIEKPYLDENGVVPVDAYQALVDAEAEYLETLTDSTVLIYDADAENGSVYIKYRCGIAEVFMAAGPDNCAGDGVPTDRELSVVVYQPNPDTEDGAIRKLARAC